MDGGFAQMKTWLHHLGFIYCYNPRPRQPTIEEAMLDWGQILVKTKHFRATVLLNHLLCWFPKIFPPSSQDLVLFSGIRQLNLCRLTKNAMIIPQIFKGNILFPLSGRLYSFWTQVEQYHTTNYPKNRPDLWQTAYLALCLKCSFLASC